MTQALELFPFTDEETEVQGGSVAAKSKANEGQCGLKPRQPSSGIHTTSVIADFIVSYQDRVNNEELQYLRQNHNFLGCLYWKSGWFFRKVPECFRALVLWLHDSFPLQLIFSFILHYLHIFWCTFDQISGNSGLHSERKENLVTFIILFVYWSLHPAYGSQFPNQDQPHSLTPALEAET